MDKKILNEFIDKICDMTGMECYEEELDNHVGKIELRFWGSSEVGVQVSSHLDKFSIYVPFSFEDYGKDEIESDNFYVEDLEIEKERLCTKTYFICGAKIESLYILSQNGMMEPICVQGMWHGLAIAIFHIAMMRF